LKLLAKEAVEQISDQTETKSLKIVYDVPESMQVLADRDQVRRVILNLVHNAIKWSPSGGKIIVRAVSQGDEAVISILDEGPGVPEAHRERIFERFYQVDASRSGGDGTGLGLAICKHIVEAHGGRIWAEGNRAEGSDQGRGGRFLFTLPLAEETVPTNIP
jgi:two-component system phosphate regulon sensor histidine kinase PhoR